MANLLLGFATNPVPRDRAKGDGEIGIVSRTSAGVVLILVVLLLCCAGTPAFAQYDVTTPVGQYGTAPEDQYGTPPDNQSGGITMGTTKGVVDEGTAPADDDDADDGTAEARTQNRSPPDAAGGNRSRIWGGLFVDAAALLVACSLITTVVFFVERSSNRSGL